MKKFAFLVLITAVVTYGQMPASGKSKSDAEKIASALQAGPKFVTLNAAVLDWRTSPSGEFRVLRTGANGWTCLPGFPEGTHDELGCYDQVFLKFFKDSFAGRTPNVQSVGIHIRMVTNGYLTSRMQREAAMNSTLGRIS